MGNRILGFIILLIMVIAGITFYNYGEEKQKIKNEIIKNKIKKEEKKAKLIKLNKKEVKQDKKSIFDFDKEEKENLEKITKLKLKKKISDILNINDFKKINIYEIFREKNYFIIEYSNNSSYNNYFFNKKTLDYKKLDLNIKINYSKKIDNKQIVFVTEKGSFIYSNNKIKYFSIFYDFIIKDGNYIGIIPDNDEFRKNNFNFGNKNGNLIIFKNPKTKVTKILYSTNFKIKKLLLENNQVIIVNKNNERFLLDY